MHLQPALHWCVYPEGSDSTLCHYKPIDFGDPGGISGGYLAQSPAHSRACLKDTADFAARSHRSAFLQSFSNYREEEGKKHEAIPNPAIKLQRLPGSWFSTLEGM